MKQIYYLVFSLLIINIKSDVYRILVGRTGVGKSYISSLLGCPSQICEGSQSCTRSSYLCKEKRLIDSVGLDDDKSTTIMYNGKQITLSGIIYPLWNLFELLEFNKICQAEFYFVYDANNIREGNTSRSLKDFIKNDLKCPFTRILNKYRSLHKDKVQLGDLIIAEESDSTILNGISCKFGLTTDWRNKLIDSDLEGVRSSIDIEICKHLINERKDLVRILNHDYEQMDYSSCSYNAYKGTYCTSYFLIFCLHEEPIYERKIDRDCQELRDTKNQYMLNRNKDNLAKKQIAKKALSEITPEYIKCKTLISNLDEDEEDREIKLYKKGEL